MSDLSLGFSIPVSFNEFSALTLDYVLNKPLNHYIGAGAGSGLRYYVYFSRSSYACLFGC